MLFFFLLKKDWKSFQSLYKSYFIFNDLRPRLLGSLKSQPPNRLRAPIVVKIVVEVPAFGRFASEVVGPPLASLFLR